MVAERTSICLRIHDDHLTEFAHQLKGDTGEMDDLEIEQILEFLDRSRAEIEAIEANLAAM